MSSAVAVAPKRARGIRRVDAILAAGAALFAERGFAATTMTDVAARSGTAIGSLYRFFPTKDALAEELAQRYLGTVDRRIAAIEAEAPHATGEAIADALFDLMADLARDRAAVVALIDAFDDGADRRAALRARMIQGIAAILRAARPGLTAARAAVIAPVVLLLLKGISHLSEDPDELPRRLAELRVALRLYIGHCRA